jgi:hypothetical protein
VPPQLTRQEALHLLQLPPSAGLPAIKRAYRRQARRHHPDVGGDPATFHRLRLAFERLVEDGASPGPPPVSRGRPSRPSGAWRAEQTVDATPVDLSGVDWDAPAPLGEARLSRQLVAAHLAGEGAGLVRRLEATSRAPGSRLNRVAAKLSPDLTAEIEVRSATDDRGRAVVLLEVRGAPRRARKALDAIGLDAHWLRLRGSSTTVLRSTLAPSAERRATAVRAADRLEELLERLDWPLHTWILTAPGVQGRT